MKLAHIELGSVIELDNEHISTLVVENRPFFRKLLEDLKCQIDGGDGNVILSEGTRILNPAKAVELIDSYIGFTINRKTLQAKIVSAIESAAVGECYYLRTAAILQELELLLSDITTDFTAEVYPEKLVLGNILKNIGISVRETGSGILERLLDFMELTREFDRDKLFIFVDIRSYFSDRELIPFLDTVLAHEYSVLLIDSLSRPLLPLEKRLTVDEDLCEF